jgi:hypothetical protein
MNTAQRALTAEQVRIILESTHISGRRLADTMGLPANTIQKVRRGFSYVSVHPEIPRWEADQRRIQCEENTVERCDRCVHWMKEHCTLDFPESRDIRFASRCAAYRAEEGQ